jgi:glycosyltransferase involved in cell wall biosynthesis
MRRLAERWPVWWVNTIGTRRPELNLATVQRGLEKIGQWRPGLKRKAPPANGAAGGVHVVNPLMWPWFQSAADRGLNRRLLLRKLRPIVAQMPQPAVAVTTIPIVADLVGHLPVARWVYYCVDDFSVWPGLDQATMKRMEADLIERVDSIVAVSEVLRENLLAQGRESELLTHGVDLEFWRDVAGSLQSNVDGLDRPLIVFWGVVDRRLDLAFIRRLSDELERGTIVFVGPADGPDPELATLPKVVCLPAMPLASLPRLAKEASVLIMPYGDLPVTRAMQPLKLKEYLATGKPVVVRDLPSTRPWADCLDLASSAAEFSAAVRRRLTEGVGREQLAARAALESEGWSAKAEQFAQLALADLPDPALKESYIS